MKYARSLAITVLVCLLLFLIGSIVALLISTLPIALVVGGFVIFGSVWAIVHQVTR